MSHGSWHISFDLFNMCTCTYVCVYECICLSVCHLSILLFIHLTFIKNLAKLRSDTTNSNENIRFMLAFLIVIFITYLLYLRTDSHYHSVYFLIYSALEQSSVLSRSLWFYSLECYRSKLFYQNDPQFGFVYYFLMIQIKAFRFWQEILREILHFPYAPLEFSSFTVFRTTDVSFMQLNKSSICPVPSL